MLASLGAATLLAASAARSAAPRAATPHYQLKDIGIPEGGQVAVATSVNASGQVAGFWRQASTGFALPFFWSESGGIRSLPLLPGDHAGVAISLNDAGEVVGLTGSPDGDEHAVFWDAGGTPHALDTLGGNRSLAVGINNATANHGTQVVGTYTAPGGNMRPFIWDAANGIRDIGTTNPGQQKNDQWAWAINDAGQVTGSLQQTIGNNSLAPKAFVWDEQRGGRNLDTTNRSSVGYGINGSGNVVGMALTDRSANGLSLWDASGPHLRSDLLTGAPDEAAASFIRPVGINAAGDVVYTDQSIRHASVLIDGVARDLNTLTTMPAGSVLRSANAINDSGQIVGDFLSASDSRSHAYLLTPSAAPAATVDLQVTQTASAGSVQVGGNVTFTLTVKNLGADAAHGVTVTNPLPAGAAFVSSRPAVTPVNGQLTFNLGTVAANTTQTLTVTLKAQSAGTLTNQPTASGSEADSNPANNTAVTAVTVTPGPPPAQADLSLVLTASPTVVAVGKTVTLTAVIANHGPNAASGVKLTPAFNGTAQTPINIGAVGVNKSVTRTFTVTPQAIGPLSVTATVSGSQVDPSGSDNTASTTVTVQSAPPTPKPDLSGQWSAVRIVRSGTTAKPVYTLTGTLTVRNGGTATAPATTATFAASTDGVLDAGDLRLQTAPNKPVTLKISALKAGASKAFKFSFRLPAALSPSVLTGLNVIASIDPGNKVAELDETNNVAVSGPIQ